MTWEAPRILVVGAWLAAAGPWACSPPASARGVDKPSTKDFSTPSAPDSESGPPESTPAARRGDAATSEQDADRDRACRKECSKKPSAMCETFKRHRSPSTPGYEAACSGPFMRCVDACVTR